MCPNIPPQLPQLKRISASAMPGPHSLVRSGGGVARTTPSGRSRLQVQSCTGRPRLHDKLGTVLDPNHVQSSVSGCCQGLGCVLLGPAPCCQCRHAVAYSCQVMHPIRHERYVAGRPEASCSHAIGQFQHAVRHAVIGAGPGPQKPCQSIYLQAGLQQTKGQDGPGEAEAGSSVCSHENDTIIVHARDPCLEHSLDISSCMQSMGAPILCCRDRTGTAVGWGTLTPTCSSSKNLSAAPSGAGVGPLPGCPTYERCPPMSDSRRCAQ